MKDERSEGGRKIIDKNKWSTLETAISIFKKRKKERKVPYIN